MAIISNDYQPRNVTTSTHVTLPQRAYKSQGGDSRKGEPKRCKAGRYNDNIEDIPDILRTNQREFQYLDRANRGIRSRSI
jgi:hypothetical protein